MTDAGRFSSGISDVSAPARASRDPAALLRLHFTYAWRHRRILSLSRPRRFTELVQHRKLFDRDQRLRGLIDKVAVKWFVSDTIGPDWVTPTMWSGSRLPAQPEWPAPFVVKSRHGCNQRRFVRDGSEDWQEIRRAADRWMRSDYGRWLDEWGYRGIPRGLLVEPFVGGGGRVPIDYKLYVFHGRVRAIQVHLDREGDHRWLLFDPGWRRISAQTRDHDPERPATLDRMIAAAELLARGFAFVRIDFYEAHGRPRFGEMTFYPGSGLDPFDPAELDHELGGYWLAGSGRREVDPMG